MHLSYKPSVMHQNEAETNSEINDEIQLLNYWTDRCAVAQCPLLR